MDNGDGTATLAGTPAAGTGGLYALTITATNGVVPDATQSFTLTVNPGRRPSPAPPTRPSPWARPARSTSRPRLRPATAITETGGLPSGVTFVDNGDGTATLAGTPAALHRRRAYPLTITAANGVEPDATPELHADGDQRRRPSPAPPHDVHGGHGRHVHGDHHAGPDRGADETGALPAGVTFVDNGNGTATLERHARGGHRAAYPLDDHRRQRRGPDATQSFTLTVNQAPAITSAGGTVRNRHAGHLHGDDHAAFRPAALTETGACPAGVTFVDNGDGTATLAGTPAAGSAAPTTLTITAANGVTATPPRASR